MNIRPLNLTRPEGSEPEDFHVSRRAIAALFFSGYAVSTLPVHAQAITTPSDGLLAKDLTIPPLQPEGDYRIPAYIAMPEKADHAPVVLVVSEVFGLHDWIRDVCRRLAHQGYIALAIDFFARKGNAAAAADFDTVKALVEAASYAQVMGDIQAQLDWLKSNPDVGQGHGFFGGPRKFADLGHVGITGFCWGGTPVWMAAATMPEIRCGVAWYGRLEKPNSDQFMGAEDRPWPSDIAASLTKPVLGLYADGDQGITLDSVKRMNDALAASGKTPSHLVVEPNSQHAFFADYRPSYNEAAAKDGWARLLDWFDRYL
ncbi:MAG: dienelactone hydrolase family protein [Asticcacaulis sp.]